MAQRREDIRAMCGRLGTLEVKEILEKQGTAGIRAFNDEKEEGWAREWLEDVKRLERQEKRETEANEIASHAMHISWISAVASMLSAIIALIAVLTDKS